MNKSIGHKQLISQCLSSLPTGSFSCPLLNYGYDKLSVDACINEDSCGCTTRQLAILREMEEKLRANPEFCQSINLPSISGVQLSRRINDLPTEHAQALFQSVVHKIQELTKNHKGINPELGRLKIIDSRISSSH
ncbi:hypothetical protein ACFFIS_17720 [Virgibacillus soli]|uniref:Uncharacterized protein n=1 Tax=Paracerasibacillus soli TaxID=480284 RepID=A0ABU5CSD9_9BACI|nr:hypothetical protein [Virgibacillus soli]MDY0409160.1 hypothetical protein [Virgibacillus soli]